MLRIVSALTALVAALVLSMNPPAVARTNHRSHHRTHHHRARPCSAGLVALSFDDGPSASVTPRLVRILRRKHVPATFFMVGSRVRTARHAARLVARSGFRIGNHTWDHKELTLLSDAAIRHELRSTARALRKAHVHPSHLMRPPYGAVNARVRGVLRSVHLSPILWTIDSRDWAGGTGPQIATRVLGALRRHGDNVVLQHDGVGNSPNSVSGVPRIIHRARARGFCFTTIGRNGRPVVPHPYAHVRIVAGVERATTAPTPVTVRITLKRPTSRRVSVRFSTQDLTATSAHDYVAVDRRVRFPVGTTSRVVRIGVRRGRPGAPMEALRVRFRGLRGMRMSHTTYLATIRNGAAPAVPASAPRYAAVNPTSLRALTARS